MQTKPAITQVKLHDIIEARWSPRAFDIEKPISPETLTALMEAARWAPSCFNDQPWRFIVCNKAGDESHWQRAFSCINEKNQLWAKNAPLLILSVAMENFNHNGKPNRFAEYDTGAASVSLCLQATALGLVSHQMGGFDAQKAREVFELPDGCHPMAMMAIGYQAEADILDDNFKEAESKERSRAELEERFYFGKFGEQKTGNGEQETD